MNNSSLLFGVMSGTSLDGIDIVLINQNNKTYKNNRIYSNAIQ